MGEVIYNGRSSKDVGLEVETFPEYQAPKRSYEKVHIPGRNGDLLMDGGSWENGVRSYLISIGSFKRPYFEMANSVAEWLNSATSYARLEDSYEPEYYRLAIYTNEFALSNLFNHGGKATIEFDCKPQRFLKIGEDPIVSSEKSFNIQNPTNFKSLPIIKVYGTGSGSLAVGQCQISISDIGDGVTIDSELQDAYMGTTNKNSVLTLQNGFPELDIGLTTIGFSGGVSRLEVTPRWFTL